MAEPAQSQQLYCVYTYVSCVSITAAEVRGGLHVIGERLLAELCSSTCLSCITVVLAGLFPRNCLLWCSAGIIQYGQCVCGCVSDEHRVATSAVLQATVQVPSLLHKQQLHDQTVVVDTG